MKTYQILLDQKWAKSLIFCLSFVPNLFSQPCVLALSHPEAIAVLPDGRLLIADIDQRIIFQVSREGKSSEFAIIPGKKQGNYIHKDFGVTRSFRYLSVSKDGDLAIKVDDSIWLISGDGGIRKLSNWFPSKDKYSFPSINGLAFDASSNLQGLISVSMDRFLHVVAGKVGVSTTKLHGAFGSQPSGLFSYAPGIFLALPYKENCVWAINSNGEIQRFAGQFGVAGGENGHRLEASFRYPEGLAVLPDGTVFIADTWNHVIRKINPAGQISVYVGAVGAPGGQDGDSGHARFFLPTSLATAPDGSLYVLDSWTHNVRRVLPNGEVRTVVSCATPHPQWKQLPAFNTDADRHSWLSVWWDRIEMLTVADACDLMLPAILGMTDRRGRLHSLKTNPGWDDDLARLCRLFNEIYFGIRHDPLKDGYKQVQELLMVRGFLRRNGEPAVNVIPDKDRVALTSEIKTVLTNQYRGHSHHRIWDNKFVIPYLSPTNTGNPEAKPTH